MNKGTKKRENYNEDILIALEAKYGISRDYLTKCLRKERKGIMPDKICADYKKTDLAAKAAIKREIEK